MLKIRRLFISLGFALSPSILFAGGMPTSETSSSETTSSVTQSSNESAETSNTVSGTSENNSSNTQNSENATSNSSSDDSQTSSNSFIAIEDEPLIIDVSGISDSDGVGKIYVQWQKETSDGRWIDIFGATQQSFTPRQVHVGQTLRVQITFLDNQGNLETLFSSPSSPVQNVNDKPKGGPLLVGNAKEDASLIVDTSSVSDEDGIGEMQVIWQRSKQGSDWQAFDDTTGEVLKLGQMHVNYAYRAIVAYLDGQDTREVMISSPSDIVMNLDDPVEGEVVLSGEANENGTLMADTSQITDEDGVASLSVQWESSKDGRSWSIMENIQGISLDLGQYLVGSQIRARLSVVDNFGTETILVSQPSRTIENVNNKPSGSIIIRRVNVSG
ncbi:MAG: hypothetical protein ACJ0BU_02830 [Candidatus Puniceispirillales bacterium]|tara:strand:+ start:1242 stop:2399 length:1158 start_codon:yes stop_codon:yes gene_type:complete